MKIYIGEFEGNHWAVESERSEPAKTFPEGLVHKEWRDYLASLPRILCSDSLVRGLKVGDALPECMEQKQWYSTHKSVWWDCEEDGDYEYTPENLRRIMLVPVEAKDDLSYKKFCEKCYGLGEVNKNISYGGELQADFPVECPECNGTGRIEEQGEDELGQEILSDGLYDYAQTMTRDEFIRHCKESFTITRKG